MDMELKELLKQAGLLLFGGKWKTDLAKALGIDPRRVRQWLTPEKNASYRPIPPHIYQDILRLLEERKMKIDDLITKINR